jgi:hypothetical protein
MNRLATQFKTFPIYEKRHLDIDISYLSETKCADSSPLVLRRSYSLAKVETADNPVGNDDEEWYRYVLVRGSSEITGYHRGTLKEVTKYANECAWSINERNRFTKPKSPNQKAKSK